MAPAAAARHSGHVTDVLQRDPRVKSHYYYSPVSRNLKRESERLKTFKDWPVRFLDPKILAKNGFYYTQTDDIVKCIFCKIQIGFWGEGDDPMADHLRERKDCPFVKNEPCGNIPISEDEDDNSNSENDISEDVCGLVLRPFSEPEKQNRGSFALDYSNLTKDFEELGVSKIYGPVSPNYATYASRIKTYDKWKSHDIQRPENLAEAGFYYIGVDDNVLCFHCGGGLKNWEKNDDPWVEHAKWFSKCLFVFHHKGREFVCEQPKETLNQSRKYTEDNSPNSHVEESKKSDLKKVESSTSTSTSNSTSSSSSSSSTSTSTSNPNSTSTAKSSSVKSSLDDAEIKMCRICFTRERGIVFLPCGHFVCCPQCTPSLSKCAVCREPFKATVRAYLS